LTGNWVNRFDRGLFSKRIRLTGMDKRSVEEIRLKGSLSGQGVGWTRTLYFSFCTTKALKSLKTICAYTELLP
jgi:hypothetical protein